MAPVPIQQTIAAFVMAAAFAPYAFVFGQASERPKPALSATSVSSAEFSEHIDRLIEQLGDPRFTVRERAQHELADIGVPAFDALTAAQSNRDLEIAHRARTLVQSIRMEWVRDSDSEAVRKLLADYDAQTDPQRRNRIAQLAAKPQAESLSALCRVVRFERSVLLSKEAAMAIMDQKRPSDEAAWAERSRIIREETELSKRPSVVWLQTYADFSRDPNKALAVWKKLIDEEDEQTRRLAAREQRAIQAGLLRQQVIMLLERDQQDEALVAMRRLLDVESGDSDSLGRLIEWIIRQKAWSLVDEVARRLDRQSAGNAYLMYLVAQAYELRGDSRRAEEIATKALAQAPASAQRHFQLAGQLQQQGLSKWAEREYRAAIGDGSDFQYAWDARWQLATLLADQERFGEAADVLDKLVEQLKDQRAAIQAAQRNLNRGIFDRIEARAHFYRAKQFGADKNEAKQIEHLKQAIELYPSDPDLLIALYRTNQSDDDRKKTKTQVARAVNLLRQRVTASPNDATAMNEYAWLVANTEGNLEEATRYSERSLELMPDYGGFIDTLAHCYAAKKDYETALKHQAHAMELEPNSLEIKRAYERFKRLRDEQSAEKSKGSKPENDSAGTER